MDLQSILNAVKDGQLAVDEAAERISSAALTDSIRTGDLGFAVLDLEREKRTGFPEVIFGEGKTAEQITAIFLKCMTHTDRVICTRIDESKAKVLTDAAAGSVYHATARAVTWFRKPILQVHDGYVAVVCAGTSDLHVAEEAALMCESMGNHVEKVYDVGVAGIHRLFAKLKTIREANAIVVVAGMEGALPSVVAGLVDKPLIAVPTSVGYGSNFQGLSALLAMLNACAPGVVVVNIDNGFGAGYFAGMLNKNFSKRRT